MVWGDMGDVGEKLKSLCDQEKFCQSFTNVPQNIDAQWINELLSITNEYGISVCISELVLAEWCEHIIGVLEINRQKLLTSIALLSHYGISVPDIKPSEVSLPEKAELVGMVTEMMKAAGFTVIPNWDAPLSRLLNEAVSKRPPFEQGGKGLGDMGDGGHGGRW